jgi:hypothetical protein
MTDEVALPTPTPKVTPETKPFWDATAEGVFLLQRCLNCGVLIWYPRYACPDCHSTNTGWEPASGRGTIYSHTVVSRGVADYLGSPPFIFAIVELAEGPRITTNIVECELDAVHIGQEVEIVFHDTGNGPALTRFRPVVQA